MMITMEKIVKIGDKARLPGDPDLGVVQRIHGPNVDVLFEFTVDGNEHSEYYMFKCYALTWNDKNEVWEIDTKYGFN